MKEEIFKIPESKRDDYKEISDACRYNNAFGSNQVLIAVILQLSYRLDCAEKNIYALLRANDIHDSNLD